MTDALLLLSYGAPEVREDVLPFLEHLFAGKNVPPERLAAAAEKYDRYAAKYGRYSPLNDECRALLAGILREFNRSDVFSGQPKPAIYWANLFWHPMLEDTVAEMIRDGIRRAVCFTTSAFDSGATDRRYAAAIATVRNKIGPTAPTIEKLPQPFGHPLFIEAQADRLLETLAWCSLDDFSSQPVFRQSIPAIPANTRILFSAHSIPHSDAEQSDYVRQLQKTCEAVIEKIAPAPPWELVFQSRSGKPENWIGPDIKDRVQEMGKIGNIQTILVSPIGFFCENMETQNDLDWEIGELCALLGIGFFRAQAVGAMPKICRMIREMTEQSRSAGSLPKK